MSELEITEISFEESIDTFTLLPRHRTSTPLPPELQPGPAGDPDDGYDDGSDNYDDDGDDDEDYDMDQTSDEDESESFLSSDDEDGPQPGCSGWTTASVPDVDYDCKVVGEAI